MIHKFRIWSDKHNKYLIDYTYPYGHSALWINANDGCVYSIEGTYEYDEGVGTSITKIEDVVIETYTGRKDKNGTEIYAGSIVYDNQFDLKYIICFGESEFGTGWYIKNTKHGMLRFGKSISNLEIIGTIHDKENENGKR